MIIVKCCIAQDIKYKDKISILCDPYIIGGTISFVVPDNEYKILDNNVFTIETKTIDMIRHIYSRSEYSLLSIESSVIYKIPVEIFSTLSVITKLKLMMK